MLPPAVLHPPAWLARPPRQQSGLCIDCSFALPTDLLAALTPTRPRGRVARPARQPSIFRKDPPWPHRPPPLLLPLPPWPPAESPSPASPTRSRFLTSSRCRRL